MRIDPNQGAQALPESGRTSNQTTARDSAASRGGGSGALGEDQAQLSGDHVQIQALVAQVAQLPETTQGKIDALRQAVVAGKYQPSPDQVAAALFTDMVVKLAA
ncbi:MAG: flagellar biosynthesis anti-sigma factor FlgM [Candidatus Sulfotelmatobacter sp.]